VELPRMHRVARKAEERLVAIRFGMPVLRTIEHQRAERVRPVVGEEQEERPLAMGLDELDAAARPEIGRIARLLADLPAFNDRLRDLSL